MNIALFASLFLFTSSTINSIEPFKEISPPDEVVTTHSTSINGHLITYQATAGILPLKEEQGDPKGKIFYVAYERTDVKKQSERPIAFCFNGGPGAASIWLHLGFLGPKRIEIQPDSFTAPYSTLPNEYSLLDIVDLVFIDPISTGYSRTSSGQDVKEFHNVEGDVKWLSEWVRLYTTRKGRWNSPKFIIGESYGTFRAIEMGSYLQSEYNLYLNGIVLISSILDFQTLDKHDKGNDLPFILSLPSYTAAAWKHQKLAPELQENFENALQQAQKFALEEYSVALLMGSFLSEEQKKKIAEKLSFYMGISAEYIEKSNLRVSLSHFSKELLRDQAQIIGRFDSQVLGYAPNPLGEYVTYDPSLNEILGIFTASSQNYFVSDLKWIKDIDYRILTNVQPWDYGKATNRYLNATPTFRDLLIENPNLYFFIASGYFDLATPYFATDYTLNHLNLSPTLLERISSKKYGGGHMMYLSQPLLKKLSEDVHRFILDVLQRPHATASK